MEFLYRILPQGRDDSFVFSGNDMKWGSSTNDRRQLQLLIEDKETSPGRRRFDLSGCQG